MQSQHIYSRDVVLILIASFFYMASSMLVTPLITGFAGSLGAGGVLMGLVGGLSNFCSLMCRPAVGNLADRISKRRLSTVGALLMLAGYLGYVAAHNNAVVVLARVAQGVGFACCSVCMSTWMSDLLPRDRIGSGMGMYGTMNALSMAIGPAVEHRRLGLLDRGHRRGDQPVHHPAGEMHRLPHLRGDLSGGSGPRWGGGMARTQAEAGIPGDRGEVHRLFPVRPGLSGKSHHRRDQKALYGRPGQMRGLRPVRGEMPEGRPGAGRGTQGRAPLCHRPGGVRQLRPVRQSLPRRGDPWRGAPL